MAGNENNFGNKKRESSVGLLALLLRNRRAAVVVAILALLTTSVAITVPVSDMIRIPGVAKVLTVLGFDLSAELAAQQAGGGKGSSSTLFSKAFGRGDKAKLGGATYGVPSDGRDSSLGYVAGGKAIADMHKSGSPDGVDNVISDKDRKTATAFRAWTWPT